MAANEAVRATLNGPAQAPRASAAPSAPRPTPVAAVPSADFDALDRAAEGIRPSWHGAAPVPAVSAPLPAVGSLPALPPGGALPAPSPELSSSISGVQPSPLVQPTPLPALAPQPVASAQPAPSATPSAAPSASEVALYYGSDPMPRGADSTQPMPPILLPSPWAQVTSHPWITRLLQWRAQNPRLALGAGAALALVLLVALWPSSSVRLRPPPLPAAPQPKQAEIPREVPEPASAAELASAPEAPAATLAPAGKGARKATKRREPVRPVATKPALAKPAAVIAKPAPKKAVEPSKPAKARAAIAPNPYP
ncbi:MAG TPA: hypothetical protein VFZ61_31790 [Polyangiales bacterium]